MILERGQCRGCGAGNIPSLGSSSPIGWVVGFWYGAVLERLPSQIVRDMGADVVVAVNVSPTFHSVTAQNPTRTLVDIIAQTTEIMGKELFKMKINPADLILLPPVWDIGPAELERAAEAIDAGRQAALQALPAIKELLAT